MKDTMYCKSVLNLLVVCCLVQTLILSPAVAGPYKIGPGDLIDITVWKNQDLTRKLVVLPDGTVSFPLLGVITVEGRSTQELQSHLAAALEKYIPDPELNVSVTQVNSLLIYVIGKVNGPGQFLLRDDINVLQALALARGLNPFAKEKDIRIFRQTASGTASFSFNYKEVAEGKHMEQNIVLERGDVIVVP